MSFLTHLEWRNATKVFDPQKKVPADKMQSVLESIRMTPTSFGMQAYHVIVVRDQAKKEAIQAVSWNQPQVGTCSELIVFCAKTDLMDAKDQYFDALSQGDSEKRKSLADFEQMVEGFITRKADEAISWSEKQTYIAMGFAMAACAELEIDSCPMEGFDAVKVQEILEIPQDYSVTLMLPIGYRPDNMETRPKFRFPEETLFSFV